MSRKLLALFCVIAFCLSAGLTLAYHHKDTVTFDNNYGSVGLLKMTCNREKGVTHYIYYSDLDGNGRFSGQAEIVFEIDVTWFGRI